jgi:hypothetical protein
MWETNWKFRACALTKLRLRRKFCAQAPPLATSLPEGTGDEITCVQPAGTAPSNEIPAQDQ